MWAAGRSGRRKRFLIAFEEEANLKNPAPPTGGLQSHCIHLGRVGHRCMALLPKDKLGGLAWSCLRPSSHMLSILCDCAAPPLTLSPDSIGGEDGASGF